MSFEDQFAAFSKFGDTSSDGKHITLTQSDKWMKQANVIDGKRITTTDTSIHYKKQKSPKLSLVEYKKFIEDMATTKKVDAQEIYDKMTNCGAPGQSNTTKSAAMGVTDRLTDTSKYTGSHKERFDASGKGKGIEGRADVTDNDGYVSAYKNKDTYDKTHPQ